MASAVLRLMTSIGELAVFLRKTEQFSDREDRKKAVTEEFQHIAALFRHRLRHGFEMLIEPDDEGRIGRISEGGEAPQIGEQQSSGECCAGASLDFAAPHAPSEVLVVHVGHFFTFSPISASRRIRASEDSAGQSSAMAAPPISVISYSTAPVGRARASTQQTHVWQSKSPPRCDERKTALECRFGVAK
jgi:hypothetical protein